MVSNSAQIIFYYPGIHPILPGNKTLSMKKITIVFLMLFCSRLGVFAQDIKPDTVKKSDVPPPPPSGLDKDDDGDTKVFTLVEQEAEFPGGQNAWVKYLTSKLGSFEPQKGAKKGTYTVIAKFIVSRSGRISAVETETHYGYGMEEAVLKLIKQSPNWKPAVQNGRTVNAYRRQPVTFVVE